MPFNGQELWVSGGNVAWVNFARDIGPGATNLAAFDKIFADVQASGGNAMRLWLHTSGSTTPEWNPARTGEVVGPGVGAIDDLRAILDLAWKHEVGLQLCLWSFDMLRSANGTAVTDRNYALLTDADLTQTYIDHALVPMVEALRGHPGVLAWEIFNEPEGMSHEHGWSGIRRVPMATVQRFVNQTAGAIHRADPQALVTNGSWAFIAASDTPSSSKHGAALTAQGVENLRASLAQSHRLDLTTAETEAFYDAFQSAANFNYYRDDRLVAAGGDADGTLDFYNVHYYEWAGTALSPFHHAADAWGLDKPLVVAEFFMGGGDDGDPDRVYGIPQEDLYTTLYDRGYAGAMAWQWYNYPVSAEGVVNWPRMLAGMQSVYDAHPEAVMVQPGLRILRFTAAPRAVETGQTSTLNWSVTGAASVTLDGAAVDSIGTRTVAPATTTTYTLVATDRSDASRADTAVVTVEVRAPDAINRALDRMAVASTVETCCGAERLAAHAFDGDLTTRWSSEWQDGFADDDPDDEWIYVDLGAAYDLSRVVLHWEAAYGTGYRIDVSYDARLWTTLYEETAGDGGVDEIALGGAPGARYVRLAGVERGTEYGYSLWEIEVYGLRATRQPPTVRLTAPAEGAFVTPGASLTLTATAADPDGSVEQVAFYADGTLLATASATPFEVIWTNVPAGTHTLTAIATDADGLRVSTAPVALFAVENVDFTRYEAEASTFSGDVAKVISTRASGRAYLDLKSSGGLTFSTINVPEAGEYLLSFSYNLAYDTPKAQILRVNDGAAQRVTFSGPTGEAGTWLRRGLKVSLQPGLNTLVLEKEDGWMHLDYLEISENTLAVATAPDDAPGALTLGNRPNPFRDETTIAFTLDAPAPVTLAVFDVTGRRVALLIDGLQPAGTHAVPFAARGLASGVYFFRLHTPTATVTQRMLLLR